MTLSDLKDKNIILLGFGATNRAFYLQLRKAYPDMHITIGDQNLKLKLPDDPNISAQLGEPYKAAQRFDLGAPAEDGYLVGLDQFDVIVRTPGIDYTPELFQNQERVTTATNIFFDTVRATTSAKIIGVTGTKGKSTTSSMIHDLLRTAGRETVLIGNIDNQDWDVIDQVTDDTFIVYELSSYMLEDFMSFPNIAVMLNVFPDHLDWHGAYSRYVSAKANITARQSNDDLLIFNALFDELVLISKHTQAFRMPVKVMSGLHWDKEWFYDGGEEIMQTSAVKLIGDHNKDNVLAVLAVAKALKIDYTHVVSMLAQFKPLPHRLEIVATVNNVTYVNDAISTTPESTIAAIKSFENVGSIALGGLDRGYDYTQLAQYITERKIPTVVLFFGAREKIKQALQEAGYAGEMLEAILMDEAVKLMAEHTPKNHVALLSTAAPSYDEFKNYIEQGDTFKKTVTTLKT